MRKLLTLLLCGVLSMTVFTACSGETTEKDANAEIVDAETEAENKEEVSKEEENKEEENKTEEILNEYVYSGEELLTAGRPLYNNDMADDYSGEVLTDTGVNYTFHAGEAIRGVLFENLSINLEEYNTVSFRVRSLTGDDFFRWRLYIHSDLGGNLQTYKDETQVCDDFFVEMMSDGTGTNVDLLEVSEPDEEGWITVTFDAGDLNYWENATVIDGFRIAWVNFGTDQEVSEVTLSLR